MSIVLTPFARTRLFPNESRRNTIQDCTPEQFERHLNDEAPLKVLDGYAPFCKLHVHRNWTSTRCLTVPITDANRHLLRTAYEARTKEELPVLVRWFEGVEPPVANWFVVILYSREQLAKEGAPIDADWGVVGCIYTAGRGRGGGRGDRADPLAAARHRAAELPGDAAGFPRGADGGRVHAPMSGRAGAADRADRRTT